MAKARNRFSRIGFFFRPDFPGARVWERRIAAWVRRHSPGSVVLPPNAIPKNRREAPSVLVVLGGDGTILEASQKFQKWNPLVFGLNLGRVGFLASIREPRDFFSGLRRLFAGEYRTVPRMMVKASLIRRGKTIYTVHNLNDVLVQSLFSLVKIKVCVDDHPVQQVHGSGVLVSTATGSTAYNLSAHGPIVMPDIRCLIVTELMDHNLPTPSLIIKRDRAVSLQIQDFRKRDEFLVRRSNERADVILTADTANIIPLQKNDTVVIRKSPRLIRFAELDRNYFFRSLEEKLAFR
jgi:NAD+ kinase